MRLWQASLLYAGLGAAGARAVGWTPHLIEWPAPVRYGRSSGVKRMNVRVAAVQHCPVLLDRDTTPHLVDQRSDEAAAQGAVGR